MKNKKIAEEKKIINIILMSLIVFLGIIFVYINLGQYKWGLNADIAAEGLLAREIWESKEWIPRDWYFSSESRLIGVTNLAAIFYGMTNNICLSMGLGCIAGMIIVLWSFCLLCKKIEFDNTQKLLIMLLILLLPNNKVQIELLYIFAGHYVAHIGLYFITLSFYLSLLKKEKVRWYWIAVLFLLHFVLGAQGVRGILMITGPLLATEVVRRIYLLYCKWEWKKEDNIITVFAISLNVMGFLGGMLPISVGYPLSRNIRKAPQKFFQVVMPDFFATLDWTNISLVEKIMFAVCLFLVLYLVICIVLKGWKKKKIHEYEWVFLNFIVSVFLTIAALTFTTVDSSNRYFVVIYFAIAMAITILWKDANRIVKIGLFTITIVIMLYNCSGVYLPMVSDKSFETNEYAKISDYLIAEGYENAYATFEHANVITLTGNEKIQVSAVASLSNMEVCKWLSCKKWYVPNVPKESKTAYIVSDYRLEEFDVFLQNHKGTVEFKTKIGTFNIYGSDYNYSKLTD